jgi:hypothetical protein
VSAGGVQRSDRFLKGFQLVDDLVLRRLQVTDCKGSRHGCEDANHRSYGNSYEQPYGSRREAFVRLLGHEKFALRRQRIKDYPKRPSGKHHAWCVAVRR